MGYVTPFIRGENVDSSYYGEHGVAGSGSCGKGPRGRRHTTSRNASQGYEQLNRNSADDSYAQPKHKWANSPQINYESLAQNDDGDCYNKLIQGNIARHNNVVHKFSDRSSQCPSYFSYQPSSSQNSDTEDVDEESHPVIAKIHNYFTINPYYNIV
jgi:hypothetical protein